MIYILPIRWHESSMATSCSLCAIYNSWLLFVWSFIGASINLLELVIKPLLDIDVNLWCQGYCLFSAIGCNIWFVRDDSANPFRWAQSLFSANNRNVLLSGSQQQPTVIFFDDLRESLSYYYSQKGIFTISWRFANDSTRLIYSRGC